MALELQQASGRSSGETGSLKRFIISAFLAVGLCVSGGYLAMALHTRSLIQAQRVDRARRQFDTIVQVREWNASHGGVWVEAEPGEAGYPWKAEPDLVLPDGRRLAMIHPARMTREISQRMDPSRGHSFHITSLAPVNPASGPDPREAEALRAFEKGERERMWTEEIGGRPHFRYMAPLVAEASCMKCHASQGYKVGDVRGGISVSFDVSDVQRRLRANTWAVAGLGALSGGLLLLLLHLSFTRLVRRLAEARAALETLASTDALTGLLNRRIILQRFEEECERSRRQALPLSCLMLDLDHFKRINDTFGHPEGDRVLREVAAIIRESLRPYDLAGRFGGEEFLVLLPGADAQVARLAAERLCAAVPAAVQCGEGQTARPVTLSLGFATFRDADSPDSMIFRADEALYRAKEAGRNRAVQEV